jgi:hypothetical protein
MLYPPLPLQAGSAVRREANEPQDSLKTFIGIGVGLALGLVLLGLAAWSPWGTPDPAVAAQDAFRQGDYNRALAEYREAAKDSPDPGRSAHNLGATLAKLRRFAEAEQCYRCAGEAGGEGRAARAAYDRANCEIQWACANGEPNPELLARAVEHYRACLGRGAGGDPSLVADARHNLELAKLLQARAEEPPGTPQDRPPEKADTDQPPKFKHSPADGAGKTDAVRTSPDATAPATVPPRNHSTSKNEAGKGTGGTKPPPDAHPAVPPKSDPHDHPAEKNALAKGASGTKPHDDLCPD